MTTRRTLLQSVAAASVLRAQPASSIELLVKAVAAGDAEAAKKLLDQEPALANTRARDGRTPLQYAAEAAHPDLVLMILSRGANLDAGPVAAMLDAAGAADFGAAYEMTAALAGNNADPNARDTRGRTPLHRAAAAGHAPVVELLIHRLANPAAKDDAGKTPLDVATGDAIARLKNQSQIERIYRARRFAGVKMPASNSLDQSLVNQFASVGHFDLAQVKTLLSRTPELLLIPASWDELAVEAGAHTGQVPIARYLTDAGAPASLCTATVMGEEAVVRRMLREDPHVIRDRGAHDQPPLHYAAFAQPQIEIAKMLVESGARPDTRGFGQTALHVAARGGHLELAEFFLAHGADINARAYSRKPVTPLTVATNSKQEKMVEFLKSRGALA